VFILNRFLNKLFVSSALTPGTPFKAVRAEFK